MPRPTSSDLAKLPRYEFEPLQDGERMRILEVLPAQDPSESVLCNIQHVPHLRLAIPASDAADVAAKSSKLEYEAISHRWGSGAENQSIRILKHRKVYHFPIHEDLYEALVALRHKDESRFLWVDTICINQEDLVERSKQVARMNEVYSDAINVCVWLGPENKAEGSTEALQFLERDGLKIYEFDDYCVNEKFVKNWSQFLTLLKREWFSRRWVVQEVALAQKATVHCGPTSVRWEDFAAGVSLLNDIDMASARLTGAARKMESLGFPEKLFDEVGALAAVRLVTTANRMLKRAVGGHQRTSTLEEVVARLAMFQSGEPRDYIYALLALAKDSQPYAGIPDYLDGEPLNESKRRALDAVVRLLPSAHRQSYLVDYTQDVVDVYQQFIAFAITKSDPALALDVICRPFAQAGLSVEQLPGLPKGLPTWIPVVSELPFAPQINPRKGHFKMERQRGDPFVSMPDTTMHYNAAGRKPYDSHKVRFRKRSDHYSMFVEGFVLDTVAIVEPASQRSNIPEQWIKLGKAHENPDAFWRTLVADRGPKGDVPGIYGNAIKAALEVAVSDLDIAGHIRDHPSVIISAALPHVQDTIWGRCLIQTERKYLGLGPKKLEALSMAKEHAKLKVCIIHGCSVPVILKECDKTPKEMKQEQIEDEEDRRRRQEKAVPIIRKMMRKIAARKAAREAREGIPRSEPDHSSANGKRASSPQSDGHRARKRTRRSNDLATMFSNAQDDGSTVEPPPKHYYEVVGECFIHNMMHGEAIKWQNDTIVGGPSNRVKARIFELR